MSLSQPLTSLRIGAQPSHDIQNSKGSGLLTSSLELHVILMLLATGSVDSCIRVTPTSNRGVSGSSQHSDGAAGLSRMVREVLGLRAL